MIYIYGQSDQRGIHFYFQQLQEAGKISTNDELVSLKLNEVGNVSTNVSTLRNFSLCVPPLYYPKIRLLQSLSPSFHPSCPLLFKGNEFERARIKKLIKSWTPPTDEDTLKSLNNCSLVRKDFSNKYYVSSTESNFSIAVEMLIYYTGHHLQQQMRLLKYLYRPQNVYCIHIDKNSPQWFINKVSSITKCLPNVIIAKNLIRIYYGSVTILDAHLSCLKDLLDTNVKWKYAITLHSTELPLVTMKEIVDILIKMNGSNVITVGYTLSKKYLQKWFYEKQVYEHGRLHHNGEKLGPVPYNITPLKSATSVNNALSRDFVKFLLTDKRALSFRKRLEYVRSAEEFFFTTMNSLPYAPGNSMTVKLMPQVTKRLWSFNTKPGSGYCIDRKFIHYVCITSASDLPKLQNLSVNKEVWFFNKYLANYDHVVMDCMESLLIQRNYKEYENDCL